jgi:hypothetical protein
VASASATQPGRNRRRDRNRCPARARVCGPDPQGSRNCRSRARTARVAGRVFCGCSRGLWRHARRRHATFATTLEYPLSRHGEKELSAKRERLKARRMPGFRTQVPTATGRFDRSEYQCDSCRVRARRTTLPSLSQPGLHSWPRSSRSQTRNYNE